MKGNQRLMVQLLFLVLLAVLAGTGRLQLWMGVILVGLILAPLAGRLYCGWVCPWNTIMEPVETWRQRRGWPVRPMHRWLRAPWIRYVILAALAAFIILGLSTGRQVPLLLLLFPLAVVLVFFFHPALWHRYLCPYGVLFSMVSPRPLRSLGVDAERCNSCGACVRVCPAEAISLQGGQRKACLDPGFCLECLRCVEACPRGAIAWQVGR